MMDFCKTEECFWREGAAAQEELMTGDCLMVFGPVGMLERDGIVKSIGLRRPGPPSKCRTGSCASTAARW